MASVSKRKWVHNGVESEAWVVRYRDETGARRSKQFELKKVADTYRRRVEREIEDGLHVAEARTVTVARACKEFLAFTHQRVIDGRIGRSRYGTLRTFCDTKITPALGAKLLRDLRHADVEDYYGMLVTKMGLQPLYARDQLKHLKLIEDFANKRGYMKTRPVSAALSELRGLRRDPIRTFTVDEVRTLIDTAGSRAKGQHTRSAGMLNCFVNIAAFCGLRRGEIGGLTLKHVDLDLRLIEVRHSLTEHRALKGPKTVAGIRDVPMPRHVIGMLREWIDAHYLPNPDGLIFAGREGKPLQINLIQYLWSGLLARAGLAHEARPFHFHALRHFYASMMIEAGTPLADAAILLGHQTFDTTLQVYTHSVLKPAARHGLVERMMARISTEQAAMPPQGLLTH